MSETTTTTTQEPTTTTAAQAAEAASASEAQQSEQPRTFTQEDVDRIVADRIKRERHNQQQALAQARDEARAEGQRLAQMNEAERAEHDAQAAREREETLRTREAELTRRELRAEAVETLAARDLPQELAQMLNYTDAEACAQSIDELERVFRSAVQKGVDARIRESRAPLPRSNNDAQTDMLAKMRAAAGLKT